MPAYGSCAGMILLASEIVDAGVEGRIEVVVPEDGVYAVYAIRKPA